MIGPMTDDTAAARNPVLITVAELAAELAGPTPPKLLDVRWRLDRPDGRPDWLAGHLPGAAYVDLETELAQHGEPAEGRHPIPEPARLQEAARRWGLDDGDPVVVYDDLGGMSAARAWWLLLDAGVASVRILDGGLAAWRAAGHRLETGEPAQRRTANVTLGSGRMPRLSADETAALAADGVLLDARAGERYRGETEPVDPRAGHVPGAISAPTAENLDGGRFLAPAALLARFAAIGVHPGDRVGVYCGSGVTAAHEVAALAVAGIDAALYPGSWSAWSNQPERPVATGPEPWPITP